ncbi:hypothetical protein N7467_001923 [Penicillium canescens]|nr:hypothetical protein N7467_001923 [Penicillium canescens]
MELRVTTYPHIQDVEGITTGIDDEPVSASAGVARHQGSRLPKMTKCELPSIDKLTGEETDSSDWVMLVENSLQPMMLGGLIDAKMPRPKEDDPLYRRWNFWSSSVAAWMYLQVDKGKHADQLFEELVSYAQDGDPSGNVLLDVFKLYDMKRDHYGSAEEYISHYQIQMNIPRRSKIAPPAFISVGIMVRELQDELPNMVFMREALRKVKEPHEITHEDFDKNAKKWRSKHVSFQLKPTRPTRPVRTHSELTAKTTITPAPLLNRPIRMARAPEDQGANMTVDEKITAAASEAADAEVVEEAVEHRPDSTPTMEALQVPVELCREERTSTNTRGNAEKQRSSASMTNAAFAAMVHTIPSTASTSRKYQTATGCSARPYGRCRVPFVIAMRNKDEYHWLSRPTWPRPLRPSREYSGNLRSG